MTLARTLAATALLFCTSLALAHDTWVQTNTNMVRVGDVVHVDLMLGNHGNDHRDFKLASKIGLEGCTLSVIGPTGKEYDQKGRLADLGYAPKEGFWSARFKTGDVGMHVVAHSLDRIVNHGKPVRAVKSGKSYFLASKSLDKPERDSSGFEKPLGHPLELVPLTNPVTSLGPGKELRVRLLFEGKPLPGARVSFIPRGAELTEGFDERFERKTDASGNASFTPTEGNYCLVVVHHADANAKGADYESTHYSATLTVLVPEVSLEAGK